MAHPDPVYITVDIPIASALNISGLIKRRIDELKSLVSSGVISPEDELIRYYEEGLRAINEKLPAALVK